MKPPRPLLALSLLVIVFSPAFHAPVFADMSTPAERVAALDAPATVFILAEWSAIFSYPYAIYSVDNKGQVTIDPHAEKGTFTDPIKDSAWWGSGFIISPDGYILTNSHIASTKLSKEEYILGLAKDDMNGHLQAGDFKGYSASSSTIAANYLNARISFYETYGKFSQETFNLIVVLGSLTFTQGMVPKGMVADVKAAGDPVGTGGSDKDVAVIKVTSDFAMPTVPLGDSSQVNVGQSVFVIGYPAIESATTSASQVLVSSVTAGIISSFKSMPQQWQAIQTDATIHPGNSGGPALNANGEVIGLATFGSVGEAGQELSGINFLVPINIAKEFLAQVNVQPKRGMIDQYWADGLNLFWNKHYSAAIDDFQKVLSLYPGHPYAIKYMGQAEQAVAAGRDVPILFGISGLSWLLLGAVVVAVAVLVVVTLVLLRRRKPARSWVGPQPSPPPPPQR